MTSRNEAGTDTRAFASTAFSAYPRNSSPDTPQPPYRLWMTGYHGISWVNSGILWITNLVKFLSS